jgi:hypothetical protein
MNSEMPAPLKSSEPAQRPQPATARLTSMEC